MRYSQENWRNYATHDDDNIKGFFGPYRWLSNFHLCSIPYEGLVYPSTENAYQAAKVDLMFRDEFVTCSPNDSKTLWKKFNPKYDAKGWDEVKLDIMNELLVTKFNTNDDLKQKLIDTDRRFIEETNCWGDVYWGVCDGVGENVLGNLIMGIRDQLQFENTF